MRSVRVTRSPEPPAIGRCLSPRTTREALAATGLPATDTVLKSYPHQLSGGMRQRAAIASHVLAARHAHQGNSANDVRSGGRGSMERL